MNNTRLHLVLAFLLLFFFVATSAGFANVSGVQEQLRDLQLKLVKERLKQVQEQILQVSKKKSEEEPPVSREELKKRVENRINALDAVVRELKPRAIQEETARLEARIAAINQELPLAEGERLIQLKNELAQILKEYAAIQEEIKKSLQESLEQKQALLLQQQARILQEKILLTPQVKPVIPVAPQALTKDHAKVKALQEDIEKVQLRLLQEQSRALQRKIDELKSAQKSAQ